jgi:hypothetical protein
MNEELTNEEILAPVSEKPRSGITRNTLKYIAIAAMVIDHTAHAFVPGSSWLFIVMRFIGRITGPVMFFAAAEGYHHTKNINRYMARLAVFAAVSYFPFMYFIAGGSLADLLFFRLNVIYTIFLGVTAIRIRRELKNPVVKTLLIIVLFVVSVPGDWGTAGILIMLVFDYFYGNFKNQAFAYCIVVILNMGIIKTAGISILNLFVNQRITFNMSNFISTAINMGMFLPIILLRFYNQEKGRGGRFSKWFFYIFYPLHLLLLGLARSLF